MFNKIKYPALNAKMRGMYANSLNKDELDELLRQNNLKDTIYYLKNKFPSLDNIDESMHRKEIEQELDNLFINNILKIEKYLNAEEKNIFRSFLLKYELDCVKNVLRNITTNRDLTKYLKDIDNWTNKLFNEIRGINSVKSKKEFFEILKKQEYYCILQEYEEIDSIKLEEVEVRLDKFYFTKIYNLSESLSLEFKDIIGSEIDLLNIVWCYRSRKNFGYFDDEIRNIIIPINYKIRKDIINKLIETEDFEEVKYLLQKTPYKNVFTTKDYIEHDKGKFLNDKYLKCFKRELFDICTVFCNINLLDIEIKNIINIIEGIRYKLDKSEIQKRIII